VRGVIDSDPEVISVYVKSKAPDAVRIGLEAGPMFPYRGENSGPGKDDRWRASHRDPELENYRHIASFRCDAKFSPYPGIALVSRPPGRFIGS
jgi:hypothetical protein